MTRIEWVQKRNGAIVPFNPERITNAIYRAAVAVGGRDRATAEKLTAKVVEKLLSMPDLGTPHVELIQDVVEDVLIHNGHARVAKAYILYRAERARARNDRANPSLKPSAMIPWAKIWQVLDWAVSHNLHTVQTLNQRLENGDLADIIVESEAAYAEDVENAVTLISERLKDIKIVIITGPSSSGKTTTTSKISLQLKQMGAKLVTLNLDNYFFDLEFHPRDEFGDYDFETPQAMDIPLINQHLLTLLDGGAIEVPDYDFRTGKRTSKVTPLQLHQNDIILIDSLHGLYPALTNGIDPQMIYKVYLEPLLQMKDRQGKYIRWTDIRLMRRMLRDTAYRAYDSQKTLEHWHYVRSSEMRNIIPNINNADYIINSAMPYELSIYRPKLLPHFEEWSVLYDADPLRQDAARRAIRARDVLRQVNPVENDSLVPAESVLREFIGGSIYS